MAKLYGTDGWPETYIIDRKGIIRRKVVGDPDWSAEIRPSRRAMKPHRSGITLSVPDPSVPRSPCYHSP